MPVKTSNLGEIAIYRPKSGEVELQVKFEKDTVWLSQKQMAELFYCSVDNVGFHLKNIYSEKELIKSLTYEDFSVVQKEGERDVERSVRFYNLDAIISVGYRVNSSQATQFRIWATSVLKKYLLDGYAVNEKRLLTAREKFNQLQNAIAFLRRKSGIQELQGQEKEILNLLADYSKTLTLLNQYDKNEIKGLKGKKSKFVLKYDDCQDVIIELKKELSAKKEASDLFGRERSGSFEGIIKNLYQTFSRKELYPDIEAKASHLLYLIIKDHPFSDGNKRLGAFFLIYFLDKNDYLYRKTGEKKINDNALTALALLVASSEAKEKDQMIALIIQLLK